MPSALMQAPAPAPLLAGSQGMLPRWASAYTGDGAPSAPPVRAHGSLASPRLSLDLSSLYPVIM